MEKVIEEHKNAVAEFCTCGSWFMLNIGVLFMSFLSLFGGLVGFLYYELKAAANLVAHITVLTVGSDIKSHPKVFEWSNAMTKKLRKLFSNIFKRS